MYSEQQAAPFIANPQSNFDSETAWRERYSRQIKFAPIGENGQSRLGKASVLIVGCGALGASLAQHMVRAGVGEVRLADRDFVELSNLHRQVLFDESDALEMLPKAVAAASRLRQINSESTIIPYVLDVTKQTLDPLIAGVDLVLDGTDHIGTRLLLGDACFAAGIPFVYGGVAGSQGMSAMLVPGETVCLRCMIGDEEQARQGDTCDTIGVLSSAAELVTSLQSIEAIKWLSGNHEARRRTLVSFDLWSFQLRELQLPEGPCHCSQGNEELAADQGYSEAVVALCGRDTVQVTLQRSIELEQLKADLQDRGCELLLNRYLLKARLLDGEQLVVFSDGRVLVQGTSDISRAIKLCKHYLDA